MKKSKKYIASVMASALAFCSVPAVGASAAPPPSTEPRIYVDLTEDDKGIRVDIIMENLPEFSSGYLFFDLGTSWECAEIESSWTSSKYEISDVRSYSSGGRFLWQNHEYNTGRNYVELKMDDHIPLPEYDHNGIVTYFYIKKTSQYDTSNSAINLICGMDLHESSIFTSDCINIFDSIYYSSPRMLEADEFMYGDVTGDSYISGSDATWALSVFQQHGERVKVTDFYKNYTDTIKDMKAAYAADVNKDGYIDETDANIILYTYTELLSGKNFDEIDGIVGDIDVYEVY